MAGCYFRIMLPYTTNNIKNLYHIPLCTTFHHSHPFPQYFCQSVFAYLVFRAYVSVPIFMNLSYQDTFKSEYLTEFHLDTQSTVVWWIFGRVLSRATLVLQPHELELVSWYINLFQVRNTSVYLFVSVYSCLCFSRLVDAQFADCIVCLIHFQKCRSRHTYIRDVTWIFFKGGIKFLKNIDHHDWPTKEMSGFWVN